MSNSGSGVTRRSLLGGMLGVLAAPAWANAPLRSPVPPMRPTASLAGPAVAPPQVTGSLETLLARAGVSGQTALIALDAETGAVIEHHRADLRMPPASTAKAVTALFALQTLGSDHRFVTRVEARGAISGGVLQGDLVLRGGGDPTLQTEDLARLAEMLVQQGLRRVTGRFEVDDGALPSVLQIDDGQPPSAGYNPAVGGLNLNFNRVHFSWETREGHLRLALDARSEREMPAVSVIGITAAARDLPVYTHALRQDGEDWTVAATALAAPGSRWLPVRRAGAYAGDVFRVLLATRGCQVPPPQVARSEPGRLLAEHRSAALTGMVREMLRYSTNITAEALGLSASQRLGARPRGLESSAGRMNRWIGERYGASGMGLIDHSGLGPGSRISPRVMASYMLAARREGVLPGLLREHPLREGVRLPVQVHAKTGTLDFVSALTGYAQPQGGRAIVFSIISADMDRRTRLVSAQTEQTVGARSWTAQARGLQQSLIERWAGLAG